MAHIGIVGAGLSGLTLAYRLGRTQSEVTLFESSDHVGGQIATAREHGCIVELGAEGYVARSEALPALASALGIEHAILRQSVDRSFRFENGEMITLPPGVAAAHLDFQVAKKDVGAGIHTFAQGMGQLTEELARSLAPNVRIETRRAACSVRPADNAVEVELEDGKQHRFDAVAIATTARVAGALLSSSFGPAAHDLASLDALSNVSVSLTYPRPSIDHPLDGTGCVMAEPHLGCRAITFTSSKFAGRAPYDIASLRVFFRPIENEITTLDDVGWRARAERVVQHVFPSAPMRADHAWVSRWERALPVWNDESRERVARARSVLSNGNIHLVGSAFDGSGIDAAVRAAEALAARMSSPHEG